MTVLEQSTEPVAPTSATAPRMRRRRPRRPAAVLALVSGAQFMFILDLAIVMLAIPSIQRDLRLEESQLQWVTVAYGLTLGGLLLMGGRVADLVGRRRVFVAGLGLFTLASLTAGLSGSLLLLVASRAAQGAGAAFAAPAALSILTGTYADGPPRNRALAIFGATGAAAASIGQVVGGLLTTGPGWEWVFLVNVPIGAILITFAFLHLPAAPPDASGSVDVPGAITVTTGLMAVVYGIHQSVERGWTSLGSLGALAAGITLLAVFAVIERRAPSPILPPAVFRQPTLATAAVAAALLFGSFLGFNFQVSLLMQQVLGYTAIEAGLAWLAASIGAVVVSVAAAARAVERFGAGSTLAAGQCLAVVGLLLLSRVPSDARYVSDLFPGMLLIGVAVGLSATAVQVAAFIGVERSVAGIAGGIVESFREIGGALGTAIIATVVLAHAGSRGGVTGGEAHAFVAGVHRGAFVAAVLSATAALIAATVVRRSERRS
jgi:EmrB/QacA subfamily drug resistance transporter